MASLNIIKAQGSDDIPYNGNIWQGEVCGDLANEHNFTKLKPSKHHMHVT